MYGVKCTVHRSMKKAKRSRRQESKEAWSDGQGGMEASGQGLDRTRGPGMHTKARCGLRPKAAGTVEWRCAGEGHAPIFLRMVTDCRVESALWSFSPASGR